ncbi:MAG: 7-cyano-7-deazaguanine synthase, partial [Candidatus Aenigmarchaeota archaeon]|nr:7-cyano-7-deazaguanine synthase [Candidatus Aenigmarchaeota archaeon]
AERVCGQKPAGTEKEGFDAGAFIEEAVYTLRERTGGREAVVYASGGVDSTVAAMLAKMAGVRIKPVHLDMGNGRKNEARHVSWMLSSLLETDVYVHDRAEKFIAELHGVDDPEQKRKIFSRLYADTKEEVDGMLGLYDGAALIQGTIATDRRETGREAGKGTARDSGTVDTIKTHHNVGAERHFTGLVVSPLEELTKERVRMVAREIGIPPEVSERQPFPGPGLFVRFATGYYIPDTLVADEVSVIASDEGYRGYALPRKGVGLKGDERAFEHAAFLSGERDWEGVRRVAKQMIEDLPISRVLYFPHERAFSQMNFWSGGYDLSMENLDRLRDVTDVVERTMDDFGVRASQTPVITFGSNAGWINVIRDVQSEDFRTCRPLKKPEEFPWECYDEIGKRLKERLGDEAGLTTFDVSDKPGGTTEWE